MVSQEDFNLHFPNNQWHEIPLRESICHFKNLLWWKYLFKSFVHLKNKWVVLILSHKNCLYILDTSPLWIYVLQIFSPIFTLCGGILRSERLQLRRAGAASRLDSFILKPLVFQELLPLPDLPWGLSHSNQMETSQWILTARVLGPLCVTPCSDKHHLAATHTFSSSP